MLLMRRGNKLLAVGAQCSHFGPPMEQDLLVDNTVRSPWHHTCFSRRKGEAMRAPVLDGGVPRGAGQRYRQVGTRPADSRAAD